MFSNYFLSFLIMFCLKTLCGLLCGTTVSCFGIYKKNVLLCPKFLYFFAKKQAFWAYTKKSIHITPQFFKIAGLRTQFFSICPNAHFILYPAIQTPYSSSSNSLIHTFTHASLGIRSPPLGDTSTLPTFGPSGRQERLNC